MSTLIPPPQRHIIGTCNGQPVIGNRDWYLYWTRDLPDRVTGVEDDSTSDLDVLQSEIDSLSLAPVDEPLRAADDLTPALVPAQTVDDLAAELHGLRAIVAELVKEIDGLKAGTIL